MGAMNWRLSAIRVNSDKYRDNYDKIFRKKKKKKKKVKKKK